MNDNTDFSTKSAARKVTDSSNNSTGSNVPDFIQKLFRMLENEAFKDAFCWNTAGTRFLVKDTNEFSKTILPKHFKHCNFASFVRQLNKYDFHKIRNKSDDNQKAYSDQVWEFEHIYFKRDRKDLLEKIKRKSPGKKGKIEDSNAAIATEKNDFLRSLDTATDCATPVTDTAIASTTTANDSVVNPILFEELKNFTKDLQKQINQLKESNSELEATVENMSQKEKLIKKELEQFQYNLKAKDELIKECIKVIQQQQQQQPQVQASGTESNMEIKAERLSNSTYYNPLDTGTTTTNANTNSTPTADIFIPPTTAPATNSIMTPAAIAAPRIPISRDTLLGPPLDRYSHNHSSSSISFNNGHVPTSIIQQPGQASSGSSTIVTPSNQQQQQQNNNKTKVAIWKKSPRVLLVDDDSIYRDVSGRMLNKFGCSIELARDGLEALQKISVEKYDLILMDIVMPKMDGIATTRNIRRYDSLTPIVSMTSNFTHNDIMEYIGIGMNDILPKPFSKNTLYDILEKHCAHLKLEQQQSDITYDMNTQNNDSTATPSTSNSTPTNNSPITNNTIGGHHPHPQSTEYWQSINNSTNSNGVNDRKMIWSTSSSSASNNPANTTSTATITTPPAPMVPIVPTTPMVHHHLLSPSHSQPSSQQHAPSPHKRQKLTDLYDTSY
ncbi:hypothetical protein BDF20DRAFT_815229 [Mycotypha africana]|uniref:uncharacterized protein n=1 Tax=Mycotypha africana TaxID=64632 RepID=UPI002300F2CA|nr:uncharacterized protein BDF20DRAFT_815229 [Mycotypha africana]KAI8988599.1 hypothetical protein BDF20DRAFT_815229 [Mycotypha africana]